MPLPERYSGKVPDLEKIWSPEGYFKAQGKIWLAQCEARHELDGAPNQEQLNQIRQGLILSPEDIQYLNNASGHETNNYLRLVQSRMSPDAGNFVHKGNTSSDVLDTSLSMQIVESLDILADDFIQLNDALITLALNHRGTLQIARTHGQHAIPHTFGRQVLGWAAEVERGRRRIASSRDIIAVGKLSGEVGTNVFIDPQLEWLTLEKLGLEVDPAPTQIISRDRHAEVTALMAINGATLGRIATNIRLLSMTDIGEVREPFDASTQQGSSAMPHKRNSELTERASGLNRQLRSSALSELDAVISWLERDISHSSTERFVFPDVFPGLSYTTHITTEVIKGLEVFPDRMLENMNRTYGAIYSSRLLNAILDTGTMIRTDAYELVKGLAQKAMDERTPLLKLAQHDAQVVGALGYETLSELFNPAFYLRNINIAYQRMGIDLG